MTMAANGVATPVLEAILTCPNCGHRERRPMPTDACQWFHECEACHALLHPKAGDCCVFCSYADHLCPPMQAGGTGCGPG